MLQFELEQQILAAWNIISDIDLLIEKSEDLPDEFQNYLLGLKTIYSSRFEKLFETFEEFNKETYTKIHEANSNRFASSED